MAPVDHVAGMTVAIGTQNPPRACMDHPVKLTLARIRIVPTRLGDGF
jgi:hypothetical protein